MFLTTSPSSFDGKLTCRPHEFNMIAVNIMIALQANFEE